jgi:SAM-dependent methyltransferase
MAAMGIDDAAVPLEDRRTDDSQTRIQTRLWQNTPGLVGEYANRTLRPVEALLIARYRDELSARVLELGPGAGRLTGYLIQLGADVLGLDISPAMVEYCRAHYPDGEFRVGDLRDLSTVGDDAFGAVVAGCNMLDLLSDAERKRTLTEIRRILVPGGLLVMSSHNAGHADRRRTPWQVLERNPVSLARNVAHLPRRVRNRRRIRAHEQRAADHMLLNDEAHDFSTLHYYVSPDALTRQFEALGFAVPDRLDLDGRPVPPGDTAPHAPEIHYAVRAA